MSQAKFQLVGSLLRPANLRQYKTQIEERDDISYPLLRCPTRLSRD